MQNGVEGFTLASMIDASGRVVTAGDGLLRLSTFATLDEAANAILDHEADVRTARWFVVIDEVGRLWNVDFDVPAGLIVLRRRGCRNHRMETVERRTVPMQSVLAGKEGT
jgi:hypothetical protein